LPEKDKIVKRKTETDFFPGFAGVIQNSMAQMLRQQQALPMMPFLVQPNSSLELSDVLFFIVHCHCIMKNPVTFLNILFKKKI
jgi:hypothetical protein